MLTLKTDVPTCAKNIQQNTRHVFSHPDQYLTVFFHMGVSKGTLRLYSSDIESQIILDDDKLGHTAITVCGESSYKFSLE